MASVNPLKQNGKESGASAPLFFKLSHVRLCRSGGDEPGARRLEIGNHKRHALNTWLSSGTYVGTFACPAGPWKLQRRSRYEKTDQTGILYQIQKKGPKIDPHVSNLRFREFLFQGVQVHP